MTDRRNRCPSSQRPTQLQPPRRSPYLLWNDNLQNNMSKTDKLKQFANYDLNFDS